MITQFQIDCALMAGASYISTRTDNNKFPVPQGWTEQIALRVSNDSSGFEAITFKKGTEIVISYAGTNPNSLLDPDNAANIGLATGFGSDQLLQAAEYYLQVKAANPTATSITFTGHSLGGGLAALMGVFFGKQAVTFDQAPFANSAELNLLTPDVAANLKADLLAGGHTEAELSSLTNFLQLRTTNGGIPNSNLVSTIQVDGEFTSSLPIGLYDPIGTPATVLDHGPYFSPSIDMHSQSLLTAFLQSNQTAAAQQTFSEVTKKLTDLLGMIFDDNLFEHPTNDPNNENFLEHLVRHEAGIGAALPADRMVTRFTSDLWKLAQDWRADDGRRSHRRHQVCQQSSDGLCHADVLRRHRQRYECEQGTVYQSDRRRSFRSCGRRRHAG